LLTRRLDELGWEVVARPQYVTVEFVPPAKAPRVPDIFAGNPESAKDDVAVPYTPEPPSLVSRLLEEGCEVVARPEYP
jgi:hypothetical protein